MNIYSFIQLYTGILHIQYLHIIKFTHQQILTSFTVQGRRMFYFFTQLRSDLTLYGHCHLKRNRAQAVI